LERIGVAMEQRSTSKGENRKKESRDDERSKDGPRESQEEKTLLSASC